MTGLRRNPGRPNRSELLDLYKGSVDEYRFQVQLNWSRSQYLLAFNVAIVAAGAGLTKVGSTTGAILTAGVFLVGVVSAALSTAVTKVQHGYYRTARDRMIRFEGLLNLKKELRVDTTPTMGGKIKRIGRITTMLYIVFVFTAGLDLVGIYVALDSQRPATSGPPTSPSRPSTSTPSAVTPLAPSPSATHP
jgi:hypothetical protein